VAEVTGVLKTSEVQYCFSMEILNSIHEIGSRTIILISLVQK
jgi:hypothetical protein